MQKNLKTDLLKKIKASGFTQTKLAAMLGMTRQQLHIILTKRKHSLHHERIVKILASHNPDLSQDLQTLYRGKKKEWSIPLVTPDDILHILENRVSVGQLSKPFYDTWSFATYSDEAAPHFCMHVSELAHLQETGACLAAFQLACPLEQVVGMMLMVYFKKIHRCLVGTLQINPHTKDKMLITSEGTFLIGEEDCMAARCTQLINHFVL